MLASRLVLRNWLSSSKTGLRLTQRGAPMASQTASRNWRPVPRTLVCATRDYTQSPFKTQLVHSEFPKFTEKIKEPLEIRLSKKQKALFVKWEDGCEMKLPAEFLRVESPSAEVQGHGGASEKRLIFGRMHVNIIGIEPQGHYGVLLKFDDLHESGIFSWEYLHYLGVHKFSLMKKYIKNLRAAGKSRNPLLNQRTLVK